MRTSRPARVALALTLAAGVSFPGCATILHGTYERVHVSAESPKAVIRVDGDTIVEPGSVKLKRGHDHTFTAESPGAKPVSSEVKSRLSWGYTIVDTLLAIFLFPIGLVFPIVDAVDGAICNLDPTHVYLPAPPAEGAPAAPPRGT